MEEAIESLRRLTVEQILSFCNAHNLTGSGGRPEDAMQSKRPFLERLCRMYFPDGLPLPLLVEVDFLVQQRKPRVWVALQLQEQQEQQEQESASSAVHADVLAARLHEQLRTVFSVAGDDLQVHARRMGGRLWVRVSVRDTLQETPFGRRPLESQPMETNFFLCEPQSPFMLVTDCRKRHLKEPLLMAMAAVFRCKKISTLPLRGKDPDALFELLLDQQSQGAFRKYRTGEVDASPLDRTSLQRLHDERVLGRKRGSGTAATKGEGQEEDEEEEGREDHELLHKRRKTVQDEYGEEHPVLEEVVIKYVGCFSESTQCAPSLAGTPLKMRITLQGESVLDGIQKLCDSSAIRHPIPEVFRELPGCGANRVRVDAEGHVRRGRAGKKKGKQRHRHQHRQ